MTSKLKILVIAILLLKSYNSIAQEAPPVRNPPVWLETMVGDRGVYVQMLVNKKFQSIPKLGFFSVSSITGEWNQRKVDDMMNQAHLTYEFYKGFTVNAGFHHTPMTGIRPTAGIMYSFANPEWTVVIFPRTDIISKPDVELFTLIEYKPKINEKFRFYSRFQGMYVHNPDSEKHQKSGLALRAGISHKEFTIGAAFNADYYGPVKHNINNFGGFVSFLLF